MLAGGLGFPARLGIGAFGGDGPMLPMRQMYRPLAWRHSFWSIRFKAARLGWELKRLPVQYLVNGRLRTMDDRFVLVRSDTYAALSVVSGDSKIVQPREVLEFYRELMMM